MEAYVEIEGSEQAVHIQLRQGDITRQTTDAIVNFRPSWFRAHASGISTPSSSMLIMKSAGPIVDREYWKLGVQGVNRVVVTSAGNLPQHKMFHLRNFYEPEKLRIAVIAALRLAEKEKMKSIVFPVFDCSDNLQRLVSSLYKAFDDFTRRYHPECLNWILIVVPDRRLENFYLAVRELYESSVLVDVMYKEPMREVLEATGMICKTSDQLALVTFTVQYINDDDDDDEERSVPRRDESHAVVGFCTEDDDDEDFFVDDDDKRISNFHGIEKWYTQKNPVVTEGMTESDEINLALNKLGYDGSWGDGRSTFGPCKRNLIFVFYEGIRFELANRSPYTFQIVEDIRAPAKHLWLRSMVHKALRLTDQRGFVQITFVIKRTVCGNKTDALYIVEAVDNFAHYYKPVNVKTVNVVTTSGNVFDAFKAGRRLHKWMKEPKHLVCRHQRPVVPNSFPSLPYEQNKYRALIIFAVIAAVVGCIFMVNKLNIYKFSTALGF